MSIPPVAPQPTAVAAGWYPNPSGQMQWWDGSQWGVMKPTPNRLGTAAAIVGGISFFVSLIPFAIFVGGLGLVTAIILGLIGLARTPRAGAVVGIVFGVLGLILGIIITASVSAGLASHVSVSTSDNGSNSTAQSEPSAAAGPTLTVSQLQAVIAAKGYLALGGFSYQGLIDQLSSDASNGFSVADATVAVDSLNADYNAQAVIAAKGYLKLGGFSHASLVEQLSSDAGSKFTAAQAEYAATQVGL